MRGMSLILYGYEGLGKTTTALQFKKDLLCISANENGYDNLEAVGDIPEGCTNEQVDTYPELIKALKSGANFKTVVLDSLSGTQQFLGDHIVKNHYHQKDDPRQAFGAFSEGWRVHGPVYAEEICSILTWLNTKGINTVLIGHAKHEVVKNPTGADYNATVIDMEQWPRAVFKKWAAAVLYMTLDADVVVTKTWKQKPMEAKATGDVDGLSDRIMYTTRHLTHEAKNLYKLPPFIPLGESAEEAYHNLFKKLPPGIQEAQKE